MGIILVVISIGVVIFVHEFGHFIAAKRNKIKVEKFYLGLGPEVIGFTLGETRYGIAAIPLGGFVKLAGEDKDATQSQPGDFFFQPWYRRILVVAAGSIMNLVLAVFLFFITIFIWGVTTPTQTATIGEVKDGFPAQKAGILKNDVILKVDDLEITSWQQMASYIHSNPEKELKILIGRGDEKILFKVKSVRDPSRNIGLIGISPAMVKQRVSFIKALRYGINQSIMWNYLTLKYVVTKIVKFQKPELSGPVGIVQVMTKTVKTGIDNFLFLVAIVSNSLALFNLFPIPLLDGGHMLLFTIEGIIRKPLDRKYIEKINAVGLAIILFIILFATYSDILRMRQ